MPELVCIRFDRRLILVALSCLCWILILIYRRLTPGTHTHTHTRTRTHALWSNEKKKDHPESACQFSSQSFSCCLLFVSVLPFPPLLATAIIFSPLLSVFPLPLRSPIPRIRSWKQQSRQ